MLNSRVLQVYSLSTYNRDKIVPDYDPSSISTYNGTSALPSPARTWTTHSNSISTYYAGESADIKAQAAAVTITYQTSPNGAFAKHYIDGVNFDSTSLYGPIGGTTSVTIPLTGGQVQDVKIIHSGFNDKRGNVLGSPVNAIGTSMASNIQMTPNGSPILTDTWTFTGVNGTSFSLKRNSTGVIQTLNYSSIYNSTRGNGTDNGIPGYSLVVTTGPSSGHSATVTLIAPVITIDHYDVFKNFAPISGWQTPIQDAQDEQTIWNHVYLEAPNQSTSTYVTKIEVGDTLPVDTTWSSFVPTDSAVVDLNPSQFEEAYRQVISDAGQLIGRYCRVTFTMNDPDQFIRYPQVFYWNPNNEAIFQLIPPIVRGTNVNKFVSAILATYTNITQKIIRLRNSMAVSTAEQEYLIQIGTALGFPIGKNELLSNYQHRLALTIGLATAGSTLSSVLAVIQAYANSTQIYIVQPNAATQQWLLGTSILGISTYLGAKSFRFWEIEIHTPGALTNLLPDVYEQFVRSILPIGCVPVFIWE